MPAMAAAFASLDAPSSPTRPRSSTCCSASAARSAPPCWPSCSSGRWSAPTRSRAAAAAYGTAFWVSAGLTALAIIPCIVLVRAERAARAAKGERRPTQALRRRGGVARDGGGGVEAGRAARAVSSRRPVAARPLVQGGDGRRAPAARARDAPRRASSATPSTACCSGCATTSALSARELAFRRPLPRDRDRDARGTRRRGSRQPRALRADKRVVLTSLTERGRELVEARRARYEPRWRAALARVQRRGAARRRRRARSAAGLFDELAEERQP